MRVALLPDRGVVKVAGDDARTFLHGLLSADVLKLAPGAARFCALLSPQGKIIADFIVTERRRRTAAAFSSTSRALRPNHSSTSSIFYKLRVPRDGRRSIRGARRAGGLGRKRRGRASASLTPIPACRRSGCARCCRRIAPPKRPPSLGATLVDAPSTMRTASRSASRAAASISATATPFRTKPTWTSLAASISTRAAMSARKSSRAWSTAAARAPVPCRCAYEGAAPLPGLPVMAGEKQVGTMGSTTEGHGLALVRLDRVADALVARQATPVRRSADPADEAGLGALCLSRRVESRRMSAPR